MQNVNAIPLVLTGNNTTSVRASYTEELLHSKTIEVFNSDTTNNCFVISGSSTVTAASTNNIIPAGKTKTLIKNDTDTNIAIVFGTTSTAKVYVVAGSSDQKT